MSKGKPRHNPKKRQNKMGWWCDCCEEIDGRLVCELGVSSKIVEEICKGNPHNCCKVGYRQWAGKDDKKEKPGVIHIHC